MMTVRNNEDILKRAFSHLEREFGLEYVKPSLVMEFDILRDAHDAIHEFIFLAPLMFPGSEADGWLRKSAFLVYHWEAFHYAHRSLIEALCAYYNVAFVLLRATFELLIKGAFWECLSHKAFRQNSTVLDGSKTGRRIKNWLDELINIAPEIETVFEHTSVSIYDKMGSKMENRDFRPSARAIIRQLAEWGMFTPIPDAETLVYDGIYQELSSATHVNIDKTDIGRRIVSDEYEVFEQELLPDSLRTFAESLHQLMDLGIVVELNVLQDLIQYDEAKSNLRERLISFEQLGLRYSSERAKHLLEIKQ